MAIYGALGEGFDGRGTRPGEYLSRGLATMAGTTLVVTVPAPMRLITHVQLTIKKTTGALGLYTAGNYTGNQFTIYSWAEAQGSLTGGGTPATVTVSSPTTFTATTSGILAFNIAGATAGTTTISFTRGAFGPVNLSLPSANTTLLIPYRVGDVIILTNADGTPTLKNLPDAAQAATAGAAYSSTETIEWAAWGTVSGVSPVQNQP